MRSEKNLSANIFRILRTCMGLSLKDMANKCDISVDYLGELELGKKTNPSTEIIQKVANICEINPQTIRYFLEQQKGDSLVFQRSLISSLDQLAKKMQSGGTVE